MSGLIDEGIKEVNRCVSENTYSNQIKWKNKMTDCMSRLKSCERAMKAWDEETLDMVFQELDFVQGVTVCFTLFTGGV